MIRKLTLLHDLTAETYHKICARLELDGGDSRTRNHFVEYGGNKVRKIFPYNIVYERFGHLWFMEAEVDFPQFGCDYADFGDALYAYYREFFGAEIMADFPAYDRLCCNYIEYSSVIPSENPQKVIDRLALTCPFQQLNKDFWDEYHRAHNTIEFCLAANGNQLETLARCRGTALKNRITDPACHKTVGLFSHVAVNKETEEKILGWLYQRYKLI